MRQGLELGGRGGKGGVVLKARAGKVIVRIAPGPTVQHAPTGQQDEVVKALANVTAGLVYCQHDLRSTQCFSSDTL